MLFVLLLLVFEPMLDSAISMTTRPIAMTPTIATPPTIHQIALDFFRAATAGNEVGGGVHCCLGDGGDDGGAAAAGGGDAGAEGLLGEGNDG